MSVAAATREGAAGNPTARGGDGVGHAIALTVPLFAFFMVQNAVNLASLAMIGRLGTAALAGIGLASALYMLLLALLFGFDTAVQAMVARASGAGRGEDAGQALTNALFLSVPFGLLLAVIVFVGGPRLAVMLAPGPAAAVAATSYLRGEAASVLFLAVTIPFNAYWIGSATPRIAFLVSATVAPFQIAITWPLVLGLGNFPGLGALGAGIAVSAATFAGIFVQGLIASRLRPVAGLLARGPERHGMSAIVKIGWPISLQQSLQQLGLMLAFVIVSRLGTDSVAILNVLAALTLVPIQCATGIGMACATLVGQALGRVDGRTAGQRGWSMAASGALLLLPFGLAAMFAPRLVLGLFLTEPRTLALAIWPARLLGAGVAIDAFVRVLIFALRGAGATGSATAIPFAALWFLELPLMWWIGVSLHGGFNAVVGVRFAVMLVEATALAFVWHRGRWARVRIGGARATPSDSSRLTPPISRGDAEVESVWPERP